MNMFLSAGRFHCLPADEKIDRRVKGDYEQRLIIAPVPIERGTTRWSVIEDSAGALPLPPAV